MRKILETVDELKDIRYFGLGVFHLCELEICFDGFEVGELEYQRW